MKKLLIVSLIFLTLFFLAFSFRKNNTITKQEAIEKCAYPNSKFINWKGSEIHFVEFGDKSKEQVLMIHGFGGSFDNFKHMFKLMQDDFYILAVDLPGFALSDLPNLDSIGVDKYSEAYRDFFVFIINEFSLNNFHIVGNSLGGLMAWETAYAHSEKLKSVTLLASAGYETDKVTKNATGWLKSWYAAPLFSKGLPKFMAKINMNNIYYDKSKVTEEGLNSQYYTINKEGNFPFMLTLALTGEQPDTSKISSIKVPTLIIWGENDKIIPAYHAEKFGRDIENSKVVVFEKCGHVPQLEMPQKTYKEMMLFFNEINQALVLEEDTVLATIEL